MARFTATFTITETTNWEAGDVIRWNLLRDEVMQNIEWFAQTHDHSGDAGDGGTLAAANPLYIWMLTPPLGGPFN